MQINNPTARADVKPFDAQREFFFVEGCFINELANSADDPAVSIAQARVAPGAVTRWHWLVDTVERYVILSGSGRVELGEAPPQRVGPGDVVTIPALCPQRIANTGSDDLLFLAICTPRFVPDNYRDIEAAMSAGSNGAVSPSR